MRMTTMQAACRLLSWFNFSARASHNEVFKRKFHWSNTLQQQSIGVGLLTASFVRMAFTIQLVREFTRLWLNRSVGGVLALAFSRDLSPVITSIVVCWTNWKCIGTIQVSEQTDKLWVLGAILDAYLVTPKVIACCVALPFLTLGFALGIASSAFLADSFHD